MSEPPQSSSSASNSSIVKRACDCCHKRKVKCIGDGNRPCKNCTTAGLTCTYNAVPQKKGPKGSRAKVISELRETQRQTQYKAGPGHTGLENAQYAACFARTPGLLSNDLITACVDFFFTHMYPTQPILHRVRVGETIGQMDNSIEAYCLGVSLCAYMLIQPNITLPPGMIPNIDGVPVSNALFGNALLGEALRVRKAYEYVENPSIWSVVTSFFFFGSYFCLDKHNTAWFHLREATTLAHVMAMDDEQSYKNLDNVESSRRRRLYWLLFVTERAYALQRHRPLSLYATINLPSLDEDPAETVELSGFIHLVNLFKPFDDTFVALWNKSSTGCTTEWLGRLQGQLADALPAYLSSTEAQAVDLRVSQQWLRTMVWQLSISQGYLSSSTSAEHAMSFKYPIEISRDLIAAASGFTQTAMEVHGIGLIEKLFDVACTLVDVMAFVPMDQYALNTNSFELGPRDYLHQFITVISGLRGGQQKYLPLLIAKINDTMPAMPGPGLAFPGPTSCKRAGRLDGLCCDGHNNNSSSNPTSGQSSPLGGSPSSRSASLVQGFGQFGGLSGPSPTLPSGFSHGSGSGASPPFTGLGTVSPVPNLYQDSTSADSGYPGLVALSSGDVTL